MGGRLNIYLENHLKFDLFLKIYIYSERGKFSASFYNKNSVLMFFFRNGRFLESFRPSFGRGVDSNIWPFSSIEYSWSHLQL